MSAQTSARELLAQSNPVRFSGQAVIMSIVVSNFRANPADRPHSPGRERPRGKRAARLGIRLHVQRERIVPHPFVSGGGAACGAFADWFELRIGQNFVTQDRKTIATESQLGGFLGRGLFCA